MRPVVTKWWPKNTNCCLKITFEILFIFSSFSDINIVKRKLFASTKPDIVIEVDGKKFKVQTVMPKRTINAEFTLDEPYENDMKGEKETYLTTLDGNKLVTKVVSSGNVITTREFNGSDMIQTYYAKNGVSGTRTFSKA